MGQVSGQMVLQHQALALQQGRSGVTQPRAQGLSNSWSVGRLQSGRPGPETGWGPLMSAALPPQHRGAGRAGRSVLRRSGAALGRGSHVRHETEPQEWPGSNVSSSPGPRRTLQRSGQNHFTERAGLEGGSGGVGGRVEGWKGEDGVPETSGPRCIPP